MFPAGKRYKKEKQKHNVRTFQSRLKNFWELSVQLLLIDSTDDT